jgi:DNA-binding MarR family transcriptional regulator
MATVKDFRGSRLALAETLLEGGKSASEIAAALGKPTGSIFGVLKRMVAEGLIIADSGEPQRGTHYLLSPEASTTLEEIQREAPQPGRIAAGQRLIVIDPPDALAAVQRIFAGADAQLIEWAIETGAGGWLLALRSEDSYPVQRLRMAFEAAGAKSREVSAVAILSGEELAKRAQWLLEDAESSR